MLFFSSCGTCAADAALPPSQEVASPTYDAVPDPPSQAALPVCDVVVPDPPPEVNVDTSVVEKVVADKVIDSTPVPSQEEKSQGPSGVSPQEASQGSAPQETSREGSTSHLVGGGGAPTDSPRRWQVVRVR